MSPPGTVPLIDLGPRDNVFTCFARQAEANPKAIAVIDTQGETTYGDLAARAEAVARHLQADGLAPQEPVGVLMGRRSELLAVLLGVLKAEGAYVPFDPQDPVDRIHRMRTACGVTRMIGDPGLLEPLGLESAARGVAPPLIVDPARILPAATGVGRLPEPPGGARLAYLLFTSGSTGEPKAVEVEHQQVMALLQSAGEILGARPTDRYLALSTIAFDASITELFLPLVTGATVVLRDRALLLDPHRLAREVGSHGITVLQTSPSVWKVVLDEVGDFPRVRVAITHAEAVAPALARRISACGEMAWNLYGPTETTVWAVGAHLREDDAPGLSTFSAPLGRPLPHVVIWIVDDRGNPVRNGAKGELCLGGRGVARGYRGDEARTRERFVTIAGQRAYRTGDVVAQDRDGVLHYFGRNDDQIQVRGVRVEPGEVEAALLKDTRVAQATVTWFATRSGVLALVAAVVSKAGTSWRAQDLHQGLMERLPGPMIPARFLLLPHLPRTAGGKVDRNAIRKAAEAEAGVDPRAPQGAPAEIAIGSRGPGWTDTEHAIAQIWQRLLGAATLVPEDHFFSIGGDSLTAVQMMTEVEAHFGLVLPVHLAFEAPTIEALARRVESAQRHHVETLNTGFVFPLVSTGRGTPVFFCGVGLSLARQGRWTLPCPLFAVANWARGIGFVRAGSIAELAATHLQSVRRQQPHGPYRLAGFSLGGLVAFEMAQQLREAGDVVELLFLLDPMAPARLAPSAGGAPTVNKGSWVHTVDPLTVRIARHKRLIAQGPGHHGFLDWLYRVLLLDHFDSLAWLHYLAANEGLRRPTSAARRFFPRDRWRAFWFRARRLVANYVARPYMGQVLAVFCREGARTEAWDALLGPDTDRYSLEASHMEVFDDVALDQWMGWLADRLPAESGSPVHGQAL